MSIVITPIKHLALRNELSHKPGRKQVVINVNKFPHNRSSNNLSIQEVTRLLLNAHQAVLNGRRMKVGNQQKS